MLPISEKYNDLGTIVVGKIESGRIYKGDTLLMMPNRVRPLLHSCLIRARSSTDVLLSLSLTPDVGRDHNHLRRGERGARGGLFGRQRPHPTQGSHRRGRLARLRAHVTSEADQDDDAVPGPAGDFGEQEHHLRRVLMRHARPHGGGGGYPCRTFPPLFSPSLCSFG